MLAWARPVGWIAVALLAVWLRGHAVDERVLDGLTLLAMGCAIAAALSVLHLAAGRPSKRE